MRGSFHLALSLALAGLIVAASDAGADGAEPAFVYKADGTRQCETAPGASLGSMARKLTSRGIGVRSQRKAHDGREGVAVCGSPTGSINVYEIAEADLARALELGFRRLDPSWLGGR